MVTKNCKRGQIQISFGMIFSIVLIIIFFAFAFYAIRIFFGIGDSAEIGKFVNDLQSDVNRIWRSTESSYEEKYFLPSEINKICFADFSSDAEKKGINENIYSELIMNYHRIENVFLYPEGSWKNSFEIKNLNIFEITRNENPFCIENHEGNLKIRLIKRSDEALVRIER